MQTTGLTEWVASPATQALLVYLRKRRGVLVASFLAGTPVDSVVQGRAAAYNELELLLSSSPEKIKEVIENALKDLK